MEGKGDERKEIDVEESEKKKDKKGKRGYLREAEGRRKGGRKAFCLHYLNSVTD